MKLRAGYAIGWEMLSVRVPDNSRAACMTDRLSSSQRAPTKRHAVRDIQSKGS